MSTGRSNSDAFILRFKPLIDEYLSLSTDRQHCASSWNYWQDFLGVDESCRSQTLQPRRDKRMSEPSSEADTAEYSKTEREEVCVHVYRIYALRKTTGQLSQFCKSFVWHKDGSGSHSALVLPLYEEQTVLISVTDTRSAPQPAAPPPLTQWGTDFSWHTEKYVLSIDFYFYYNTPGSPPFLGQISK